jgi:hypothetical protein
MKHAGAHENDASVPPPGRPVSPGKVKCTGLPQTLDQLSDSVRDFQSNGWADSVKILDQPCESQVAGRASKALTLSESLLLYYFMEGCMEGCMRD